MMKTSARSGPAGQLGSGRRLRSVSLEICRAAHANLGHHSGGSKFEFGLDGDELIWIDRA
jgi:hypothetical protein